MEQEELNHQKANQINSLVTQPNADATQALLSLEVQAAHLSSSVETLVTLPSQKLLQEVLGRVLTAGIGRLYFERTSSQHGRIICSRNGNYQCVLAKVPIQVFQSLISQDALAIAQQLQGKLHQLQKRADQGCEQSESLSALNQLLESVDAHLEKLKKLQG